VKAVESVSWDRVDQASHMLTDDSLMTAMDFAPANGFKDRRAGRPETPTG
jgi:hypothetical protein